MKASMCFKLLICFLPTLYVTWLCSCHKLHIIITKCLKRNLTNWKWNLQWRYVLNFDHLNVCYFEAEIHMVPCNSSVTKVWRNLYWYKDGKIYCHQSIFCDCQKPFSVGLWLWGRPLVNSTSSLAPSLFPILLQVQCKTPTFSRILFYSVSQCSLTWVVVQNFSRVQVFEARTCAAAHKHPAENGL